MVFLLEKCYIECKNLDLGAIMVLFGLNCRNSGSFLVPFVKGG